MKVLVIGCGSIGKRHISNLSEMGHTVYVYDLIKEKMQGYPRWTIQGIDAVFICTPTSTHAELIDFWKDKYLFVEKPLTSDRKDLEKISEIPIPKTNMVACNMRFESLVKKAKEILVEGIIGELVSVKVDFGYYLPFWRPDIDHKLIEHPGVIFDCFHDLDLLLWLHGETQVIKSVSKTAFSFDLDYPLVIGADAILEALCTKDNRFNRYDQFDSEGVKEVKGWLVFIEEVK